MSRQLLPSPSLPKATTCFFFLLKGGDFVINSFFFLSCPSCSSLTPDPDGPTAAYANGTPFQRHKCQLKRAACPHIHLEIVRVQCLIKMRVNPTLWEEYTRRDPSKNAGCWYALIWVMCEESSICESCRLALHWLKSKWGLKRGVLRVCFVSRGSRCYISRVLCLLVKAIGYEGTAGGTQQSVFQYTSSLLMQTHTCALNFSGLSIYIWKKLQQILQQPKTGQHFEAHYAVLHNSCV